MAFIISSTDLAGVEADEVFSLLDADHWRYNRQMRWRQLARSMIQWQILVMTR